MTLLLVPTASRTARCSTLIHDHSGGATSDPQYRNSIDPFTDSLRPPFYRDQIELEEVADTIDQREEAFYSLNNGIVTLPYGETNHFDQPMATRWINLQPYNVFTYHGNLTLNPSTDTFGDQNRIPDLVVEDNSLYDAKNQATAINESGWGTVWGDWTQVAADWQEGATIPPTANTTTAFAFTNQWNR